jgi:NAD(P)-dependent dehydrogenase (short-subunit alcohol dehydrogenase family)
MPRPVTDQVVVITGASSGIGLVTARELGRRGASVVLAARGAEALERAAADVERAGGRALAVPTDVAEWAEVEALAGRAVEEFGRIDTWVNGAAVSAYGEMEELPVEHIRRVIDVDLIGHVHGIKAALPHMRRQGAGTIIGIASGLGARAVPLQAPYCAAKAGVVGLMDALRVELEHAQSGIAVTTILPSSINTPLFDNASSRMGVRPAPIPPVYRPKAVADAIVHAAEHPVRDIVVGGGGKALTVSQRLSPMLTDRMLLFRGQGFSRQRSDRHDAAGEGNLFRPGTENAPEGSHGRFALTSPYTRLVEYHPGRRRALVAGLCLALARTGRMRR